MYESNLRIPAHADAIPGDAPATVAWPELVAKLAARRDLRRMLQSREADGGASFDAIAAAALAGLGEGKRDVNRNVLVDGKCPSANPAKAAGTAASGDREN